EHSSFLPVSLIDARPPFIPPPQGEGGARSAPGGGLHPETMHPTRRPGLRAGAAPSPFRGGIKAARPREAPQKTNIVTPPRWRAPPRWAAPRGHRTSPPPAP